MTITGDEANPLTVDVTVGGDQSSKGECCGICANNGSHTFSHCKLNVTANAADNSHAVYFEGTTAEFTDCDINATAGDATGYSYGFIVQADDIAFDDCTINATGKASSTQNSLGLWCYAPSCNINNCNILATAGKAIGENGQSMAIGFQAESPVRPVVTISDTTIEAYGELTTLYSNGIYCTGTLTCDNSRIKAGAAADDNEGATKCYGIEANDVTFTDCPEVLAYGCTSCLCVYTADGFAQSYTSPDYAFDLGNGIDDLASVTILDSDRIDKLTTARGKFYIPEKQAAEKTGAGTEGEQALADSPSDDHYQYLHIYEKTSNNVKTGTNTDTPAMIAVALMLVALAGGVVYGKVNR